MMHATRWQLHLRIQAVGRTKGHYLSFYDLQECQELY